MNEYKGPRPLSQICHFEDGMRHGMYVYCRSELVRVPLFPLHLKRPLIAMLSALFRRPHPMPHSLSHSHRFLPAPRKCIAAKVARWQNLIPSFPWIVPGWRAGTRGGGNPRKGRDQIFQRSIAEPKCKSLKGQTHMI